jgi:hypothetical protein
MLKFKLMIQPNQMIHDLEDDNQYQEEYKVEKFLDVRKNGKVIQMMKILGNLLKNLGH